MEGGVNLYGSRSELNGTWGELTWKVELTYMEGGVNLHGRRGELNGTWGELTWKEE